MSTTTNTSPLVAGELSTEELIAEVEHRGFEVERGGYKRRADIELTEWILLCQQLGRIVRVELPGAIDSAGHLCLENVELHRRLARAEGAVNQLVAVAVEEIIRGGGTDERKDHD